MSLLLFHLLVQFQYTWNTSYLMVARSAHVRDRGRTRLATRPTSPRCRSLARRAQADHMGQPDLGVLDLPVAGFAAKMVADLPDVGDAGSRDGMPLGLPGRPTRSPRSSRPATSHPYENFCGSAFFTQHQVVVVHQFCGRETVVQLDQVEILGPIPAHTACS